MQTPQYPQPFLEVRVETVAPNPSLTGWCAGFENGNWRGEQLAHHLVEWLPEFALKYSEWEDLGAHNAARQLAKAARSIYTSTDYKKRGEFGEILLHAMVRQHFKSVPAISKYFYKDSANDTIKGFDAVHVVATAGGWELWLGEVKFYANISAAVADVVEELKEHTNRDYLRAEFAAITNKIDEKFPQAKELKEMLDKNTSLDQIFKSICIPILLTYDSKVVNAHTSLTTAYKDQFEKEVLKYGELFFKKDLPKNVTVRLLLMPLKEKKLLVQQMDEVLKKWQAIL